jgi:hypothetical protein
MKSGKRPTPFTCNLTTTLPYIFNVDRTKFEILSSKIHKLLLIRNKEELPDQWKESTMVPIHKKVDKTDCSNYRGISLISTHTKFYPIFVIEIYVHIRCNYWGSSVWVWVST